MGFFLSFFDWIIKQDHFAAPQLYHWRLLEGEETKDAEVEVDDDTVMKMTNKANAERRGTRQLISLIAIANGMAKLVEVIVVSHWQEFLVGQQYCYYVEK